MDQGVGLIIREAESAGLLENTMIIFTSDNGPPFPDGRTNLYEAGKICVQIPLIVSTPTGTKSIVDASVTLLDIFPTILDWFDVPLPRYSLKHKGKPVEFTGTSLLPILKSESPQSEFSTRPVFMSHSLHEITMYYPMRAVRIGEVKIIQNLSWRLPFPIDEDFYMSPTFQMSRSSKRKYELREGGIRWGMYKLALNQVPNEKEGDLRSLPSGLSLEGPHRMVQETSEIQRPEGAAVDCVERGGFHKFREGMLNRTKEHKSLNWHKTLKDYYFRERWETFLIEDFREKRLPENLTILQTVFHELQDWQWRTDDPWVCYPDKVLEGGTVDEPKRSCLPLLNSYYP
ncbi:unnamed protein product [Notodromas monacha]|uniref:Sulfatase N-terminal domain-containing protein n=1 Tax=Notodromas monacha TaxID=399045 RepID=A0A7R9GII3_9CRUS|nr:unnamed protein product [Notodromas monacha]CAG0923877.1 unnamed protein product [Notodromas monacha]